MIMVDIHSKLHVDRYLCDIYKPVWRHIESKKWYSAIIKPFVAPTFGKHVMLSSVLFFVLE